MAMPGGFAFVRTPEGEFFVLASAMGGAFDGDLVEIAPLRGRKNDGEPGGSHSRPAARVVSVIDRAHDEVIGRYEVAEPFGVVVPEDTRIPYDIFTMRSEHPEVPDGALVRVRILQYPSRRTAATGVVEEVIADDARPRVGVDLIVARHKFETAFSEAAMAEAASARVDEAGALSSGYHDLRDRFVFTIDPADAKDFDDALSIERVDPATADIFPSTMRPPRTSDAGVRPLEGSGEKGAGVACWRLGVHIADVSAYVPWNSSIDLDARRRATSVYLVDRVIPMLPPELSDDLCSLRPNEVRRTMTVDLYLDASARLVRYEIYTALIRSNARLSYGEVQRMLDERRGRDAEILLQDIPDESGRLVARLVACSAIAKRRERIRAAAGAIDFSVPEAKVLLDDEGRPREIVLREKNDATSLVEQAMILANETVATCLSERNQPGIFRVHERPSPEALASLVPAFEEFPWFDAELARRLQAGSAAAVRQAIELSRSRAEGGLVSSLLLRSMKRALYRPENAGHYGLGLGSYCHFTSPIRRYPDLVVHRMLRALLFGRPQLFDQEVSSIPWIAEHASDMEREADEAARESQELKMIEYLERFVGSAFSGVVSGVAPQGLFVRLECSAEGFLPVRQLGHEYFSYDAMRHTLTGEDSLRIWRLGQRIAVTIREADARRGILELDLARGGTSRR